MEKTKQHITKEVLLSLLKVGALLAVAVVAPNAIQFVVPHRKRSKTWNRYYPSSVERQTSRLWRKGFVEIQKVADGYVVKITEKGKTEVLSYGLENLTVPKQESWDRKWRLVIFDIPKERKTRDLFREKLKDLGFFQMQKSVYIHPYPCENQIRFLREICAIPHDVKLATIEKLENDQDLRRIFHL